MGIFSGLGTAVGDGVKAGYGDVIRSVPDIISFNPNLDEPETNNVISNEIRAGIKQGTLDVVNNIQTNASEIIESASIGLNPNNLGPWQTIKEMVLNDSDKGVRRFLKKGLAGVLWMGTKVASIISASYAKHSNLAPDLDIPHATENFERLYTGIFGILGNRNRKDKWKIDPSRFDLIADTISA